MPTAQTAPLAALTLTFKEKTGIPVLVGDRKVVGIFRPAELTHDEALAQNRLLIKGPLPQGHRTTDPVPVILFLMGTVYQHLQPDWKVIEYETQINVCTTE